jgi:hypothetical protein
VEWDLYFGATSLGVSGSYEQDVRKDFLPLAHERRCGLAYWDDLEGKSFNKTTSVRVNKAKVEEPTASISAGSWQDAVDKSLELVFALHHQELALEEKNAKPLKDEPRQALIAPWR